MVPDARDAAGRRGIGISRTDTRYHVRSEWIFDRHRLTWLGEQQWFVARTGSQTLFDSSAVLDRSVVDEPRQPPSG